MASNGDTEEVFDAEELAEGFDEEVVGVEDLVDVEDVEGEELPETEEDEVLLEAVVPDDDETVGEVDATLDPTETILPKQDDEFRCSSCRLLKKTSQLADKSTMLCRDCM